MLLKQNIIFFFIVFFWGARAQQLDVFYLSIGSADYVNDKALLKQGAEAFEKVEGARKSARYVHEFFQQNTNGKGVLLRSDEGKFITKKAIFDSLEKVIRWAKKSKSKHPLIVFYYCGHGVSEGIAWNQFLVPGDFNEKPSDLMANSMAINIDSLGRKLVHLGDITDKLKSSTIPYMCLVDACYEGTEEKFSNLAGMMNGPALQSLKDIVGLLKFMNEYHEADPIVFATKPGTTTKTVEDPTVEEGVFIGSLCRRILLVKDSLNVKSSLSLLEFVDSLKNENLDTLSPASISNFEPGNTAKLTLLKK